MLLWEFGLWWGHKRCNGAVLNKSPLGIKDAIIGEAETLPHGHSFVHTIDSFRVIISKEVLLT